VIPVCAVIATKDRPDKLANLFHSFQKQDVQLAEAVVVDGSADDRTQMVCHAAPGPMVVRWVRATQVGAAAQRNQGVRLNTQPYILFIDDDIVLEGGCIAALWGAMQSNPLIGGVDAIVTNQCYHPLGHVSRRFFTWLNGGDGPFDGRVIAGIAPFHPEDRPDRDAIIPTEWLATACVLYRRSALPDPPFDAFFEGYSYGEDLALSLVVARKWRLANTREARTFHDGTPGADRLGARVFAQMVLVNRHYILTEVLGKRGLPDFLRLMAFEAFSLTSLLKTPGGRRQLPGALLGKMRGLYKILVGRRRRRTILAAD